MGTPVVQAWWKERGVARLLHVLSVASCLGCAASLAVMGTLNTRFYRRYMYVIESFYIYGAWRSELSFPAFQAAQLGLGMICAGCGRADGGRVGERADENLHVSRHRPNRHQTTTRPPHHTTPPSHPHGLLPTQAPSRFL
jgi:hypothetical protein